MSNRVQKVTCKVLPFWVVSQLSPTKIWICERAKNSQYRRRECTSYMGRKAYVEMRQSDWNIMRSATSGSWREIEKVRSGAKRSSEELAHQSFEFTINPNRKSLPQRSFQCPHGEDNVPGSDEERVGMN